MGNYTVQVYADGINNQYSEMSEGLTFLHAKPWIPGGEISILTAVIH